MTVTYQNLLILFTLTRTLNLTEINSNLNLPAYLLICRSGKFFYPVGAEGADGTLAVLAAVQPNGTTVVVVLNAGTIPTPTLILPLTLARR